MVLLIPIMIMIILMMSNDDYAHRQRDQIEENARGKHPPSLHTCYEIVNDPDQIILRLSMIIVMITIGLIMMIIIVIVN